MLYHFQAQAIVAKARAIYGRRLKLDDYKQLVVKSTVSEVCAYLKNTERFDKILASVNEKTIHRGQIENLIKRNNFETYEKLYIYDHDESKGFYDYYMHKIEIKEILNAIMYINAGGDDDYITSFPAFLISHSKIDLVKLAKANTFPDLMKVIKQTKYYKTLLPLVPEGEQKVDFTACENVLYTQFYTHLLEVVEKTFSGKPKKELTTAILFIIDLYNIMAVFRMRVMFDAPEQMIEKVLIPIKNKIPKKQMNELLELKTAEEMASQMPKLPHFKDIPQIHSGSIEASVRQTRRSFFSHLLRRSNSAPVVVYALLELLETEAQNVTTIIEGVRYGIAPSEIEKMIIIF